MRGCVSRLDARSSRRPARLSRPEAEQASEHLEVLAPAEDLVDGGELPCQPEQLPDRWRIGDDVVAEYLCAPAIGGQQRRKHAHERRLAGAVWSQQAEHPALLDLEIHTRERDRGAETLDHSLDVHRWGCGAGSHRD
jgi:hypothetical protein